MKLASKSDLSWIGRIRGRASPICTSNDAIKLLNGCEWEEPEPAEQLTWDAENCVWSRKATTVRVMKCIFASGSKYGCMLMYDDSDQMVYVLKAGLGIYEDNAVHSVRAQAMARNVAEKFNAEGPTHAINILPCWLYILNQRERSPALRTEPLIVGEYGKKDPRDAAAGEAADGLRGQAMEELEAVKLFELFSYHESDRQFILWNPSRIGELRSRVVYWTEPSYFRWQPVRLKH